MYQQITFIRLNIRHFRKKIIVWCYKITIWQLQPLPTTELEICFVYGKIPRIFFLKMTYQNLFRISSNRLKSTYVTGNNAFPFNHIWSFSLFILYFSYNFNTFSKVYNKSWYKIQLPVVYLVRLSSRFFLFWSGDVSERKWLSWWGRCQVDEILWGPTAN